MSELRSCSFSPCWPCLLVHKERHTAALQTSDNNNVNTRCGLGLLLPLKFTLNWQRCSRVLWTSWTKVTTVQLRNLEHEFRASPQFRNLFVIQSLLLWMKNILIPNNLYQICVNCKGHTALVNPKVLGLHANILNWLMDQKLQLLLGVTGRTWVSLISVCLWVCPHSDLESFQDWLTCGLTAQIMSLMVL